MAIETLYETGTYRYDYDTLYGTTWFVRLKDDHVSLLNTGVEAQEEVAWVKGLNPDNKQDHGVFNEIALEHSFSPRWKESNNG